MKTPLFITIVNESSSILRNPSYNLYNCYIDKSFKCIIKHGETFSFEIFAYNSKKDPIAVLEYTIKDTLVEFLINLETCEAKGSLINEDVIIEKYTKAEQTHIWDNKKEKNEDAYIMFIIKDNK